MSSPLFDCQSKETLNFTAEVVVFRVLTLNSRCSHEYSVCRQCVRLIQPEKLRRAGNPCVAQAQVRAHQRRNYEITLEHGFWHRALNALGVVCPLYELQLQKYVNPVPLGPFQ